MKTPTETPTRMPTDTPKGVADERPLPPITEFPMMIETKAPEDSEYVVDIETHVTVLVQATTPETAAAKAVLHTIEPEEDGAVTEVGRNVHTCVHSGMDDSANCDQHGEHNEE